MKSIAIVLAAFASVAVAIPMGGMNSISKSFSFKWRYHTPDVSDDLNLTG
jgi:hypothetical protein